jgi:hypothetical protein
MVGGFVLVAAVPFSREFFALDFSDATNNLIVLAVAGLAIITITIIHRIDSKGSSLRRVLAWVRPQLARVRNLRPPARLLHAATAARRQWEVSVSALAPPTAARRAGYAFAVTVTVLIWFALTAWPGWRDIGFFTEDFTRVLPLVQLSLLAAILANLAYAQYDVGWLHALSGVITGGLRLAALTAVWRVFPFTFAHGGWGAAVRVALAFAMVGTLLDMVVQVGTYLRGRRWT